MIRFTHCVLATLSFSLISSATLCILLINRYRKKCIHIYVVFYNYYDLIFLLAICRAACTFHSIPLSLYLHCFTIQKKESLAVMSYTKGSFAIRLLCTLNQSVNAVSQSNRNSLRPFHSTFHTQLFRN